MLPANVPKYLVDNRLICNERDDPHGTTALDTQQGILLPDFPYQLCPPDTPGFIPFAPLAFIAGGAIGLGQRRLACVARHSALLGGVGVGTVAEEETFVWVGDLH